MSLMFSAVDMDLDGLPDIVTVGSHSSRYGAHDLQQCSSDVSVSTTVISL